MQRRWVVLTAVAVVLGWNAQALAWDGERKGFVLGLGLGLGTTTYSREWVLPSGVYPESAKTSVAAMSEFKIGWAFTNQLLAYWNSKLAWVSPGEETIRISGLGGIGLAYYFEPIEPSWFLTGTLGQSSWATRSDAGSQSMSGFGFALGGGREFAGHSSIQAELVRGHNEAATGSARPVETTSFRITFNLLGY